MKICYHYISVILLVTAFLISGCKDNPFRAKDSTVSVAGYIHYVTQSGENQPVSNARIYIDQHDGFLLSDLSGYFRFNRVKTGNQTFRITHDDFVEFAFSEDIHPQFADTLYITVPADLRLYTITGVVIDASTVQTPIPGVTVMTQRNRYTNTDSYGRFTLPGIRAGENTLTLFKTNHDTVYVSLDVSDQTESLRIRMMPIMVEYFPLSVGNYWLFSHSGRWHNPFVKAVEEGFFSWEVVDMISSNDQTIYRVEEIRKGEATWDYGDGRIENRDLGYKKLFNVTSEGHEWVFRDQNGGVKQRFIRAFPVNTPDEIEIRITFGTSYWYGNNTYQYRNGTGILRWTYFSRVGALDQESSTMTRELIEHITN